MRDEFTDPVTAGGGATDPREYLHMLLRHVWLLLLVGALSTAAGVYYASQQPPVYESSSRIVIETSTPQILSDVTPVVDTGGQNFWAIREYLETQYRILGSSAVAGEVATRLGLEHDPVFLGLSEIEDPEELAAALETADAARVVQASVSIRPVEDTRVVEIQARAGDPETAASLANTTAEVYIERNLARRLESTDSAAEWLDTQYEDLSTALRDSEAALVSFREEHELIAVELSDHVSLLSRMEATSSQLEEARLEADRARTIVRQIDNALESGDLLEADIPSVVENDLIQGLKSELYEIEAERIELSSRYLEAHPLMVSVVERERLARERLEREIQNVLGALRQDAERADRMVSTLTSRLNAVETDVRQLGTHQVEYSGLAREAELNRELFEMIERRRKEVELSRNAQQNNVELLEVASVPSRPVEPNKVMIVGAAAAGGLFLGILLVFVLESMDRTVKSQEAVEREYGLTFLGLIPHIRPVLAAKPTKRGPARGQEWSPDRYVHDFPKSPVAESCRSIRTNLTFLATEAPLDTMLVTSPGPREGKTTTSMNVATVMAQSGTRVLLVDADMRRPRVHTIYDTQNDVGLSSILVDRVAPIDAIQRSPVPNLDILPSGPVPANPAELIESARFRKTLEELSSMYDRVIFDSPPITPVTDAAILSSMVDGVVLVVRANATRNEVLGRAVELLSAVNSNIVGAVLNDVDLTRRRGGSNYYYYYRQYSAYYGDDDEADAA